MAAQVLTLEAAKAANIGVIENGRGTQAVHDMVTAMRANARSGTACTKRRGEVAGSNKKMYRQKGTGNARMGEKRAPTRVGGGTAHGPKPRDFSKKVSKKTRKLAFSKALSERIKAGDVVTVNSFSVADGRTASFVKHLGTVAPDQKKVLIIAAAFDESTLRAARNHGASLLMTADEANVQHLLYYRKIVVTADAMETLSRRTA